MKFTLCTERLPPACTEVIAAFNDKCKTVSITYISTHPRECVTEDGIIGWMHLPKHPLREYPE